MVVIHPVQEYVILTQIRVAIHPNGQNLGTINVSTVLNEHYGDSAVILHDPYFQTEFHVPFNRSWVATTSNTFSNPVGVRFYFTDRDSIDLVKAIPIDSLNILLAYKVNGANVWNVNSSDYRRLRNGRLPDTNSYVFGKYQNIRYAQFEVKSFSTGTLGFIYNVLPLELLSFSGTAIENKSFLQWHTADEREVSHYELKRSENANNWETIHIEAAKNGLDQHYDYWDENPNRGVNYYRVKMIDFNGSIAYSKVIELNFAEAEFNPEFLIYPNPNNGTFYIQAQMQSSEEAKLTIIDGWGREVHQQIILNGKNIIQSNGLVSGMYYVQIKNSKVLFSRKVVID